MAIVYDDRTKRISDKRAIATAKNNGETTTPSTNYHNINSDEMAQSFNTNAFKTRNYKPPPPPSSSSSSSSSLVDGDETDEEKVLKVFGKVLPLVEELDKLLLLSNLPHAERINTVAELIILSLSSSNPSKVIKNAINFHLSIAGMKKASFFVAASKRISTAQAQEMLRSTVLSSPYLKKKPYNNN